MKDIKGKIDKHAPEIIEKLGNIINPLLLNFKNENHRLLIFYFHGLFESEKQKELNHIDPQNNMTVKQFTDFIDYFLSHNYIFIKPEDLQSDLRNDRPYAMITFDDGYFNNILAVEVLNKYGIPAYFFVTTRNILENTSFWWDIIYKNRTKQGNNIDLIRKEQGALKGHKYSYINDYILQNFGIEAFKPWSDLDRPFSKSELNDIIKSPYIIIGNHTHNHSILTNYSKEEIKEELLKCNNILFEITGIMPIATAFPNGNYNKLVLEVTEDVGFRYAFTIEPKQNILPVGDQKLVCFSRFMTNTTKINKFGSFCRLGYEPDLLYYDMKKHIKSIF